MKRLLLHPARYLLYLFVLQTATIAKAQTLSRKIIKEAGQPMSGVSVTQKGTSLGVTSKPDRICIEQFSFS